MCVDDDGNELSEVASLPAGSPATDPELARSALTHLVRTQPDLAATVVPRAIRLAETLPAERLDPLTLGIAGLVLVVLMTDVDWTRTNIGQWKLRIHKRALQDSTVATLIRGLLPTTPRSGQS